MGEQKIYRYPGKEAEVSWDERLCIHVAECGKARGKLFVGGRDPWCQPDLASPAEVADVCQRCPSGALSYRFKGGQEEETAPAENTITVSSNGPLFAHGELNIEGAPGEMPGVRFRAALCRCGSSKHKPFCDNSHETIGFHDYGAIGDSGSALNQSGGPLNIKPMKDGPLMITGNLSLVTGSGRVAWHGNKVALCRCGASKDKPFCDGSHNGIDFKTE